MLLFQEKSSLRLIFIVVVSFSFLIVAANTTRMRQSIQQNDIDDILHGQRRLRSQHKNSNLEMRTNDEVPRLQSMVRQGWGSSSGQKVHNNDNRLWSKWSDLGRKTNLARSKMQDQGPIGFLRSQISRRFRGQVSQAVQCNRYDVDGCSIPLGLPFFYKELFTPSCDRHDICYHCGIAYSITRSHCDHAFRNNMATACKTLIQSRLSREPSGSEARLHIDRVMDAMTTLRFEFGDILQHEMEPAFNQDEGMEERMRRFEAQAKAIRMDVMKKWTWLLYEELYRVEIMASDGEMGNGVRIVDIVDINDETTRLNKTVSKDSVSTIESIIHTNCKPINDENHSIDNTVDMTNICEDVLLYLGNKKPEYSSYPLIKRGDVELLFCNFIKELYFLAVRIFAFQFYLKDPSFYCDEGFIKPCLPSE